MQNSRLESLNGRVRDEFLSLHLFPNLPEVRHGGAAPSLFVASRLQRDPATLQPAFSNAHAVRGDL